MGLAPLELLLRFGQTVGLALLLPKLLRVEPVAAAWLDCASLPLDCLRPHALFTLRAFHPHALLTLGTLHADALLTLGPFHPHALFTLGPLHPHALFTLRALHLDALRALGPDALDSLRALRPDALLATASLRFLGGRLLSLLCLSRRGRRGLVLVLAAPLGLGRSGDCERRHGGDQKRPGHR